MPLPELNSDCGRCEALCCVALFVDASPLFAVGKPAGVPCQMLKADNRCRIHEDLAARGFGGCVNYECHGAGQYVTQALFGGRSWRTDPGVLAEMSDAFSRLTRLHALIALLEAARRALTLSEPEEAQRQELLARLAPEEGWSRDTLGAVSVDEEDRRVRHFLGALRTARPGERPPSVRGLPLGKRAVG